MTPRKIVLIVHNVRSAHNVGSILRSADGFGVSDIYLTGYTPYPARSKDERLPHIAKRVHQQISKTALGAEKTANWKGAANIFEILSSLKDEGFLVAALEQTPKALSLADFKEKSDIALIVGSEVGGIEKKVLQKTDLHLEIPMVGQKKSFNVAVAAAVALYHLRCYNS